MRQTREGVLSEWQKPQHVDQMLPICQSKQLSLQQRGRPTIWRLIIDNLRLCCFLTPLPSLSLLSFLFPFPEIRHRAPTWKPPTCVWVCHEPFLLSVPCGAPYHPASIPALCCYGTYRVATGILISPLIRLLNPWCRYHPNQPHVTEKREWDPMLLNTPEVNRGPSSPFHSLLRWEPKGHIFTHWKYFEVQVYFFNLSKRWLFFSFMSWWQKVGFIDILSDEEGWAWSDSVFASQVVKKKSICIAEVAMSLLVRQHPVTTVTPQALTELRAVQVWALLLSPAICFCYSCQ